MFPSGGSVRPQLTRRSLRASVARAGSGRRSDWCSGIPALVALGDPGSALHSLGLPSTTSLPDKELAVEEAEPSLAMVAWWPPLPGGRCPRGFVRLRVGFTAGQGESSFHPLMPNSLLGR